MSEALARAQIVDRSALADAAAVSSAPALHLEHFVALLLVGLGLAQLLLQLRDREASDRPHRSWLATMAMLAGLEGALRLGMLSSVMPTSAGDPGDGFGPELRLATVLSHLLIAAAIRFLWPFLSQQPAPWLRYYMVSNLLLAAVFAVLPGGLAQAAEPISWLWWLPLLGALVALFTRLLHGAEPGHYVVLAVACGALVVVVSAEVILQVTGLGSCAPLTLMAWGAVVLAAVERMAQFQRDSDQELEALRQQLERMVEDRTEELSVANERLQDEIAERQLAEEAMRMLERAVEQSIDGIAVADLAGGMQFINEAWAQMHGYEFFELLGYDLKIFHTPEQMVEQVQPLMEKVIADGAHEAEIEHRRRGGATFPTWQTATLLQDAGGEAIGYVFIARDITERQQAEVERQRLEGKVRQAEKLESLGRLAERVANDYNNMLTAVLANASLALQEAPEGDLRQRLEEIEASAEKAAEVSDSLLAYAGQEQIGRPIVLNDLIADHRDSLSDSVSMATLEIHLKRGLPAMRGNPEHILLAIRNLIDNAADSLEAPGGLVMLRTSLVKGKRQYFDGAVLEPAAQASRYVFFEVSDTGQGMDEDMRERIFDPYFTTKKTGRGMGLAAVLGIVRAHQGGIKVFSQPGRGTTVEVLFPAYEEVPAGLEEAGIKSWEAHGVALVVDDERLVRDVAAKVLQRQGFDVIAAANGREALKIFEQRGDEIRFVLLDFEMPEMGGEAFVQEIRLRKSQVRVLLMSGYTERNATQGFVGGQLAGFLHKPFRPNELLRKVREALESAS